MRDDQQTAAGTGAGRSIDAARGVLRASGSDNVVVKVQPGGACELAALSVPSAIYHDGVVAQAETEPGPSEEETAELRAALLVIASDNGDSTPPMALSNKEIAYLELVCEGKSDTEAAEKLGLSLRAIKSRKKSVLATTGCTSLSHAVSRFLKQKH